MRYYTKIPVWENNRRLEKLAEFRELVIDYFNNSEASWMADARIEHEPAQAARIQINRIMDETHDIILYSGLNPSITWSPPPAVGGYVRNIDLIQNIFNLHNFQMAGDEVLDFIDRSIGIYQSNHTPSLIRSFNPFYYLGIIFDSIAELPFIAIGKFGFNKEKAETSVVGRIVKGVLYLITVFAALLTILHLLDLLDPVKSFIHEILGSK